MTIRNQIQSSLAQTRSTAVAALQQPMAKRRKRSKSRPKLSTVAMYAGVFVLLVVLVALGFRTPDSGATVASVSQDTSSTSNTTTTTQTSSDAAVDAVAAAQIAANVAQGTDMTVADAVANDALSSQAASNIATATTSAAITKPSLVSATSSNSYSVTTYVAQAGDTVQSVAQKFNLSADTIKWVNNLTSNSLAAGTKLQILPTNGTLYTVKAGDTLASIASKYKSDPTRITLFNDLTNDTVTTGQKLILPGGVLPTNEQPGYEAPVTYASASSGYGGGSVTMYGGNGYAFGNCTWYAFNRRAEMGLPISGHWGNASTWAYYAAGTPGFTVNSTPSVGAVAQWNAYANSSIGYAGHVGVVESVNADGSITISEMNNYAYGGFDKVDHRTIYRGDADWPSNFIH